MRNQHYISILLLFASIALTPRSASATATAQDQSFKNPNSFWIAGDLQVQKTPDGAGESRTFARVIRGPGLLMSPASVSYVKLPSKAKPRKPEEFIQSFGRVMGIPTWFHRTFRGAHAWDSYWKGNHRFIRVYYRTTSRGAEYSVALYRPIFADRLMIETELIQRQVLGLSDKRTAYLEAAQELITAWLMIPEAHAGFFDTTQIANAGSSLETRFVGQLQGSLNGLTNQAATFNSNVAGIRTGVNEILTDARRAMGSIDTANANWAQSNIEIARFRDALTAASNDTTQSSIRLSNSMDRVSERADNIRKSIEKMQSTSNVARVAFTAGFFGYLGTAAASAGISLLTDVLRTMHIIKPDAAEQQRVEGELRQGISRYTELRAETRAAESSADELIKAVLKLKGLDYKSAEEALVDLDTRAGKARHMEEYSEGAAKALFTATMKGGSSSEEYNLSKEYDDLMRKLGLFKRANQPTLDAIKLLQRENLSKLCSNLRDVMVNLRKSESNLFLMGLDLAVQREKLQEIADAESDRMHDGAKQLASGRSVAATKDAAGERAQRDKDRISESLKKEENDLSSTCVASATKTFRDAIPPKTNIFEILFSRTPKPSDKFGEGSLETACSNFVAGKEISDSALASLVSSSNGDLSPRIAAYQQHKGEQAIAIAQIDAAREKVATAANRHLEQGQVRVSPLTVASRHVLDANLTAQLLDETTAAYQSKKLAELSKLEANAGEACEFTGAKMTLVGEDVCRTPIGTVDQNCLAAVQSNGVYKSARAAEALTSALTAPPAPAPAPAEEASRSPAAVEADRGL